MKKIAVLLLIGVMTLPVMAYEYPYLTFTTVDGADTLATFTVPSTYKSTSGSAWAPGGGGPGPGRGRGGTYVMISTSGMTSGTSYTLTSGTSTTTVTATR